ncbi:MAG TPA: hypothetical protein PKE55_00930 [Kiritimatiellia bacterium]|nr:hypothetical protein [Kiritimatiellia bacterium]
MKFIKLILISIVAIGFVGCSSPGKKVKRLELGMTPADVRDEIGAPNRIRGAKIYEDGQSTEIWQYSTTWGFSPETYWVYFENGKLVQWGHPGDFTGNANLIQEYRAFKRGN